LPGLAIVTVLAFASSCEKNECKATPEGYVITHNLKENQDSIESNKNGSKANSAQSSDDAVINLDTLTLPPCTNCNKTDANGKKQGLWREIDYGGDYTETYYKDGLLHGVYRTYSLKYPHVLTELGEFKKGEYTGNFYSFVGTNGEPLSVMSIIIRNIEKTDIIVKCPDREIKFKYKSYEEDYFPSGVLKEEGILLFDESFHTDGFKYGKWKYYDKNGKLTHTKESPDYGPWCGSYN